MIAVISDIHGNLPALQAVKKDMPKVEAVLCAGDLVGYYPYPNEVVEEIKKMKAWCIRGNHDRAVVKKDHFNFNPSAKKAVEWTIDHMKYDNLQYLANLRDNLILTVHGKRVALHHGAPFDEDFYLMPTNLDEDLLKYDDADVLILGHTHIPVIVDYGDKAIINPGAVGQPRDGNPKASYALMDLKKWEFEIRRVEYDIAEVQRKTIDAGLPESLADRLNYGF